MLQNSTTTKIPKATKRKKKKKIQKKKVLLDNVFTNYQREILKDSQLAHKDQNYERETRP